MTRIQAIKAFFERRDLIAPDGGRKVEMPELKGLTEDDKTELGKAACELMGEPFEVSPGQR